MKNVPGLLISHKSLRFPSQIVVTRNVGGGGALDTNARDGVKRNPIFSSVAAAQQILVWEQVTQ